jgi:FixJ family two-component response regulator
MDLALWFKLMAPKDRRIAKALAAGDRTGDVASKFGVSAGRISQKRREFMADWQRLQGDAA